MEKVSYFVSIFVGKYKWGDGREYVGEWKESRINGEGVYSWPDGRVYEGGFRNDLKEGHGVLSWYVESGRVIIGAMEGGIVENGKLEKVWAMED